MSNREVYETPTEIILKNQIVINDIRQKNEEKFAETGKKPLMLIQTYGCQMNEHDSEKLIGMLEKMGYDQTFIKEDADLIIFNTCCVRENAELKVFGNLGHLKGLKRKKPNLKVAVCGCMMQQPHVVEEIKRLYPFVNLVFGTHNTHNFPYLLSKSFGSVNTLVEVWDNEGDIIEGMPVDRKYDLKAYVNTMFGCNNFCTYCIVPYTRGRERSRKPEDIMHEIEDLVANGTKEITLLGQNVNSYGKTFEEKIDFSDLLEMIDKVEGLRRVRFMTSHPKDISKKLIDTMAKCDSICEQLHLPIQSGSNNLLKAMNRNYTRESYIEIAKYARETIPNLAISTDLIVGFPGETEEDLEETIDLIKQVEFESSYTFIYSLRKGTPAAEMDNQIDEKLKHDRFERTLAALNKIIIDKNNAYKDKELEVLVERRSKINEHMMMGRTRQSTIVNFIGDEDLIGKFCTIKITKPKSFSLIGELVELLD